MTLPARADATAAPSAEVAVAVGARDQLGAPLAGAVRVAAAHRVRLPVGVADLEVLVALVAGHDDDGADRRAGAHRLEHVDRAHDVGLEGVARLGVRLADDGLGGQVEDDLGLGGTQLRRQPVHIADVGHDVADACRPGRWRRTGWAGRRLQGVAGDLGAEREQPLA